MRYVLLYVEVDGVAVVPDLLWVTTLGVVVELLAGLVYVVVVDVPPGRVYVCAGALLPALTSERLFSLATLFIVCVRCPEADSAFRTPELEVALRESCALCSVRTGVPV